MAGRGGAEQVAAERKMGTPLEVPIFVMDLAPRRRIERPAYPLVVSAPLVLLS